MTECRRLSDAGRYPGAPQWSRLERTGDSAVLNLSVAADSPWLAGHFPERPVLPGVVQLRWAVQAAGELWPGLQRVQSVSNLKFQNPVLPPASLRLQLDHLPERRTVRFRFESGDHVVSRGSVRFA